MADAAAATARAAATYKQLKEDFVSNLSGGSVIEVAQVCAVAPIATFLWSALQTRQSLFKPYTPIAFIVDFLLNVGALLLSVTLYSRYPLLLDVLLLGAAVAVYAAPPDASAPTRKKKPQRPPNAPSQAKPAPLGMLSTKPFLTTYRGNMMVVTCICILAVDFRLFPRRFAKVETWGTSLMDMGVGSFVFSAGIVASRAVLRERAEGRVTPLGTRLARSVRHSLPLLALGLVRLLSVKAVDYAEHVTEYGVHWNFFFTLGFLPPLVALCQSGLRLVPSYAGLALLLAGLYQLALELAGLKAYILAGPRTNLLSMNREGVFSFWGYLAIFLAGQDVGMLVLPRNPEAAAPGASSPGSAAARSARGSCSAWRRGRPAGRRSTSSLPTTPTASASPCRGAWPTCPTSCGWRPSTARCCWPLPRSTRGCSRASTGRRTRAPRRRRTTAPRAACCAPTTATACPSSCSPTS
ncbi:hypothetical protein VTJ83DRAFT_202 [Remersonia thermophila]|uniref:GPI-anchored wall transfer protein n=1 Tax=Remersonia thermophila TaxID=72144 RepID=A0ABR4DLY3_9PEZI